MYLKIAHIFTEKIKLHLNPVTGEALDDYCETIEGFCVAHSTKLASLLAKTTKISIYILQKHRKGLKKVSDTFFVFL